MTEEDEVTLKGDPEPLVKESDDGEPEIEIVSPTGEPLTTGSPLRRFVLGTYTCPTCENRTLDGEHRRNGKLSPPEYCDTCERKTEWVHVGGLSDKQTQMALRARDTWHPPSDVDDSGFDELWSGVRAFIEDHWDASEPEIYAGLTAYALSTWVRENLTFVPHLMLLGKTTGGKTRLLNTLARVSYRAVVAASATPASMFRLIDAYDVSYYISEYHGLDYETQNELDAIVRAGQKRGETATRAEASSTGYEPKVFDPFAHVAIATQFTPDDDIINRCIQVRSSPAQRKMPATLDEDHARELRNRLLFARYRLLDSEEWDTAEDAAYGYLAEHNIEGRTREKLLSLVTVAIVWQRLDEDFGKFVEEIVAQDREASADSEDALVVEAVRDLAFEAIPDVTLGEDVNPFEGVEVPLSDVAERYEDITGTEKSAAWVGQVRNRLGLEKRRKRDGTVIADPELGDKLQKLCKQHNLEWEALDVHCPVEPIEDDNQGRSNCSECGNVTLLTHRHIESGHHMCESCAEEYENAVA